MNQVNVNTISELLSSQTPEDQFFVVCCSKSVNGVYTVHGIKGHGDWENVPPSTPIKATEKELIDTFTANDLFLGVYPQNTAGYTYYLIVRYTADLPMAQRPKIIQAIIEAHDRIFDVQPQQEIVDLMADVPDNVHLISMGFTIDFNTRTYSAEFWRYLGHTPIEVDIILDPLRFDAALRLFGWRMADPPTFNNRNNHTGFVRGTNKNYTATLARNLEGERYLLSSQTDRQENKKRERGMIAHANLEMATNTL
jgi:hypothetical protein